MSEDILAQFMEPKEDPHVVPATQPVVEQTEQERRAQEARDYLASLPPAQRQRTEEEIAADRAAVLASVPMANGVPIPESGTLTQEQMRNNPSNFQPAIEPFLEQASVSTETIEMGVVWEEPAEQRCDVAYAGGTGRQVHPCLYLLGHDGPHSFYQENPQVQQAAPVAKPQETDNRQWWVCVQSDGIRTMDNKGVVHPAFQSDVHLMDVMVRCETCESVSVRKVMPGENLAESEANAKWMRERTWKMGLNPILRQV